MPDAFDMLGEASTTDKGTIYDYPASLGESFAAGVDRQLDTNPLALGARALRTFSEDMNSIYGGSERVDQKTAEEEVRSRGLDLKIPKGGITRYELDTLQYLKQREIRQNTVSARAPGALGAAAGFAGGVAGSFTDPINIASNFIPFVSEYRYGRWLAQAGESALARAAVRAGAGAIEGAAGAAVIEPLVYAGATSQQLDYTSTDSFLNVVFGGVMGGGLHPIGGAVYDARVSRALRGLDPGIWAMRDAVANAPDHVKREMLHTAVEQVERGESVDVGPWIDLWHGSPHTFDKFDVSKIGTGEGEQAYGQGLYLAESKNVGTTYRDTLSGNRLEAVSRTGERQAFDKLDDGYRPLWLLKNNGGNYAFVRAELLDAINSAVAAEKVDSSATRRLKGYRNQLEMLNKWEQDGVTVNEIGALYQVRLKGRPVDYPVYEGPSGDQAKAFADKARAEGKPGIRYLDQGSRAAGDGSYNYVVFNDKDLEIVSRNGEPIGQRTPRDLGGLIEQAKADRSEAAFNRQFGDDADEATSRAADEAVTKASEDLQTVAEDVKFLDEQIKGLKSRELWTKADDDAIAQGDEAAKAFEKEASIYRAAAVCMMES